MNITKPRLPKRATLRRPLQDLRGYTLYEARTPTACAGSHCHKLINSVCVVFYIMGVDVETEMTLRLVEAVTLYHRYCTVTISMIIQ